MLHPVLHPVLHPLLRYWFAGPDPSWTTKATSSASEVRTERLPCEAKAFSEARLANDASLVWEDEEAEANDAKANARARRQVIFASRFFIRDL